MKKDIVREKIMQSAIQVFETFGFEKTTLDDLGRAAGMNKTSLYYYFKNKDELYAEVLLNQFDHFSEAFSKRINRKNSSKSALKNFICEKQSFIQKYTLLYKAKLNKKNTVSEHIQKVFTKIKKAEIQLLKELLSKGTKSEEFKKEADKLAVSLYISSEAFIFSEAASNKDLDIFAEFMLNGLAKKSEKSSKKKKESLGENPIES